MALDAELAQGLEQAHPIYGARGPADPHDQAGSPAPSGCDSERPDGFIYKHRPMALAFQVAIPVTDGGTECP